MFIKVNDIIVNSDLIQYMEVKSDGPFSVSIQFNVGSVKRIKFKSLRELNDFLGKLNEEDPSGCVYANAV
jgi:hypothetical protein